MQTICRSLLVMIFIMSGICYADDPYIAIELDTTWNVFCSSLQQFRNQITNFTGITESLIVLNNANQNCALSGDKRVTVYVNVMKIGSSVDTDATLKLKNKLQQLSTIGNFKVLSVEARNVPAVGFKFSNQTILLVIGLVLGIYLIGYFLILGVQQYSSNDDTTERPLAFVLAAENKYFVDGARRHKSTQYNFASKISTNKVNVCKKVGGDWA